MVYMYMDMQQLSVRQARLRMTADITVGECSERDRPDVRWRRQVSRMNPSAWGQELQPEASRLWV